MENEKETEFTAEAFRLFLLLSEDQKKIVEFMLKAMVKGEKVVVDISDSAKDY